ncbi:GMC family oxidoreductase [Klebsiella pneumoniae]
MTTTLEYDVVIIGSGGGGAPIAHTLVVKGKNVLVIDKGPLFRTQSEDPMGLSDYKRDELISDGPEKILTIPNLANTGASFYTSHVEPDLNDEPHVYRNGSSGDYATIEGYTCQCVGGGTQHYGGVSLRFTSLDFQLRSFNEGRTSLPSGMTRADVEEIRDWPLSYDDFEPWYCMAEKMVGINGERENQLKIASEDHYQKPLTPNSISKFAFDGMMALKMNPYRTPQAVITEDHAPSGRKIGDLVDPNFIGGPKTGYVNRYGDALDYKSSAWVALLRPISKADNFTLWPNCVVTHIEAQGSKINRIHTSDASGRQRIVRGKVVVVACSAIESVRLLMLSGEHDAEFAQRINGNGLLGHYFLTHCFGGASAIMPGRHDKSVTIDSDWATDYCATKEFILANKLWAGGAIYNNTSDQALPISLGRTHGASDLDTLWHTFDNDTDTVGDNFLHFLNEQFGRRLSVSFIANQLPQRNNRIELHPNIRDKWGRRAAYIIKSWHSHDQLLMTTLAMKCRDILAYGGDNGQGHYPVEGFGGVFTSENSLARIANHILGGARFGKDPSDSVLDVNCRAWNFDNLFVADGAFMPTSGGANPTLTIQANAFRVGDYIATSGLI